MGYKQGNSNKRPIPSNGKTQNKRVDKYGWGRTLGTIGSI